MTLAQTITHDKKPKVVHIVRKMNLCDDPCSQYLKL